MQPDDLIDRAAAIVRKRRVHVQQRADVVVAATKANVAALSFQFLNRFVYRFEVLWT